MNLPYKGLAHYEEEDKHLFAGRDSEIGQCAELILHSSTSVFVLHGLSGCGKSSFIRAGLIPRLKKSGEDMASPVPLLLIPPPETSSSTLGALYPLACGIHHAATEIVAKGSTKSEELGAIANDIREQFAASHAKDAPGLYNALVSITLGTARLPIFFLDQVEEIVAAHPARHQDNAPFFTLLARLCTQRVDVRICLSMRSEYKARPSVPT